MTTLYSRKARRMSCWGAFNSVSERTKSRSERPSRNFNILFAIKHRPFCLTSEHPTDTRAVTLHNDAESMYTILLVILILLLLGALPTWPYSSGWGYYPSGGLGLVVLILLILVLTGRL